MNVFPVITVQLVNSRDPACNGHVIFKGSKGENLWKLDLNLRPLVEKLKLEITDEPVICDPFFHIYTTQPKNLFLG